MDFRFRAVDDRPPSRHYLTSSRSYFPEPAFTDPGPMRHLGNVREAIQWELDKERIREEIILAEIARRRVLEAEVRAELMIEREMGMRRLDAVPFEERLTMRSDSRVTLPMLPSYDITFPGSGGGFDALPMRRSLPESMPLDIKRPWESHEDKVIVLAKRDPSVSGTKRKAVTPPAGSTTELPAFGLGKRPKDEWSCAICHVTASSEKGLNGHLQGKKHKAKEAGLRAQKMGKIVISTPLLKGSNKCSKPTDTLKIGFSGPEAQVEGEARWGNKTGDGSGKKMKITEALKNEDEQVLLQKNGNAEDSKKTNDMEKDQGAEKITAPQKMTKFKFWCEICQVGAYSPVVMEAHKKGKKHWLQLQELGEKNESCGITSVMASAPANTLREVAEKANDSATQQPKIKIQWPKKQKESGSSQVQDHLVENWGKRNICDPSKLQF